MVIAIKFLSIVSGPCETPVNPVQLITVAVGVGVSVGRDVLVGVKVGGGVHVLIFNLPMSTEVGMNVAVEVGVFVGRLIMVGVGDGVGVSGANAVGRAFPTMGMEIRKERALAETTSSG